MSRRASTAWAIAGVLALAQIDRESDLQSQDTCARPPARTFAIGAVVMLADQSTRCRLEFRESGIELRADGTNGVDAILPSVARGPDGRLYTHAGFGEVDVWSREGKHLRTIGRRGSGPGEFTAGNLDIHFDSTGRVYVRDNTPRWSVFAPSLEFIRTTGAYGMGSERQRATFLDGHAFLATGGVRANNNAFFHVYDFNTEAAVVPGADRSIVRPNAPVLVRSFDTLRTGETALPMLSRSRSIAYRSNGQFWAGPPEGAARGVELELWDTAGRRLLTFRRDIPWLVRPPMAQLGRSAEQPPPPPEYEILSGDQTGLLYVMIVGANTKWRPVQSGLTPAQRRAAQQEMISIGVDVIDTHAGAIVASLGPLQSDDAQRTLPIAVFNGARTGYRLVESESGAQLVKLLEYTLVKKAN